METSKRDEGEDVDGETLQKSDVGGNFIFAIKNIKERRRKSLGRR